MSFIGEEIWFTENLTHLFGRMTMGGRMIGEYAPPTPKSGPRAMLRHTNGRLYFSQYDAGLIGELTP